MTLLGGPAWGDLAARESLDIFLMHLYTNYVIRESYYLTDIFYIELKHFK